MAKTALIIEDSPVQALSLLRLLESHGLNVICAPNGVAGLELAHKHLPDVIVLDIHMPEMDGLEACRRLKRAKDTRAIPIVLLTAHTDPVAFRAGLDGGAVDFIPKDAFSDVVLLATLRQLSILSSDA
jgi:two-component system phosphate regulon response regulator PhoB